MKQKLQERLLRAIDDVTTAKFFVLVTSTLLLLLNKLDQSNWVMIAMMISGLKEAGNIASTWKGGTLTSGPSKVQLNLPSPALPKKKKR